MKNLLPQLLGYGLASGVAFAVDMGTLLALTRAHLYYLAANAVSFTLGAAVAYVLSVRYVFKTHRLHSRALEFGSFVSLGLIGLLVNSVVMRIVVGSLGATVVAGKCVAACCSVGANFTLRRQLLFRTRAVAP